MTNIVLIHLGEVFYPHINECIKQIKKFSDGNIYMLISENHFSLIKSDITLIPIESITKSEKHELFLLNNKLNKKFRGGFWKFASERFFYLEEIVKLYNLNQIFHFENDVLLYSDLNYVNTVLINNNIKAAATFDNDSRCIPGYVYFSDCKILSYLTQFFADNKSNKNDMELLSDYSKINNDIIYLPVIPSFYTNSLVSKKGEVSNNEFKYYEYFTQFNSLFDAAAFGQYLGGIDSRNGANNIHFVNESALYQATNFRFKWILDDKGRRCPYAIYKDQEIKINNLHIHSKRLLDFI